jgi:hypothetical protein
MNLQAVSMDKDAENKHYDVRMQSKCKMGGGFSQLGDSIHSAVLMGSARMIASGSFETKMTVATLKL